jgi:hypothetical protein
MTALKLGTDEHPIAVGAVQGTQGEPRVVIMLPNGGALAFTTEQARDLARCIRRKAVDADQGHYDTAAPILKESPHGAARH